MEQLALLKSLLSKDFYDAFKGDKCPHRLFTKDNGKIKTLIDTAMEKYKRDLTVSEIEGLFLASEHGISSAQKDDYLSTFNKIRNQQPIGADIARDILSKLFQRDIGEQLNEISFSYVNNNGASLEPLRRLIQKYGDNFLPDMKVEWEDISLETLLAKDEEEARWKFNLPTLAQHVGGVNAGHLIVGGARPNTGKTSLHASLVGSPNGFASQGAKCVVLCNEEAYHRVGTRYLTAVSGMTVKEIRKNPREAHNRWDKLSTNIKIKESTGQNMNWVEQICKSYRPDIVILDMGDKFALEQSYEGLKQCAIHARQIAKEYNCAIFYMSQLSAEAEGRINLNQSMMEGSKTGKASEADLMLLVAKDSPVEGIEDDGFARHISIAKNKLTGWHGRITCNLNYYIGRYEV